MSKIDAKYLTKVYKNGSYALKNCSLNIKDGEFLVIVGASGSGKSTLLKILAGTEKLSSGELYIDGILSDSIPTAKRDVSMVFQDNLLYPHMTVFDNLATPLKISGEDEKSIYDRVMASLRVFGLEICADVKPRFLSGGEQQRAALAKTLIKRSRLVLLDEPMSNIDEKSRHDYCMALLKMKELLPKSTFVYVTHNPREAMMLADRIAVMHDGRILEIAPKEFLASHFEYRQSMELLGPAFFNSDIEFDDSGRNSAPSYTELRLSGSFEGNTLSFGNVSVELGNEYMSRLLRRVENPDILFDVHKFSKTMTSDGFSLVCQVIHNDGNYVVLRTQDKEFILCEKTNLIPGEKIRLYYKKDDLILYDQGDRLTCHYPLRNKLDIRVIDPSRGVVEILGKRIKLSAPISGRARKVLITEDAFKLSYDKVTNAFSVLDCLDEEFINGKKLHHIALKGINGYVSVMSDESVSCFENKRIWLNINPGKLLPYEED